MKRNPESIVLLPNTSKAIDSSLVCNLVNRILSAKCSICSDLSSRAVLGNISEKIKFYSDEELFDRADLILVLGGDGSMIEAARRCVGKNIPIAGINCGRIGYLAEIEINELDLVDRILQGEGCIEERMMLDISIQRGQLEIPTKLPALNEVLLTNGPIPHLLSFDLYCNGEIAEKCYADGTILSTPTGSTAYSLSAGGPVIDPSMKCICFTPICPQTMNNRPVIFREDSILELRNMYARSPENRIYLSVDGREDIILKDKDIVRIRCSEKKTHIVRIKDGGFLSAFRRKIL